MKVQAAGIAPVMDDFLGKYGLAFSGGSDNFVTPGQWDLLRLPVCSIWRPRSEP